MAGERHSIRYRAAFISESDEALLSEPLSAFEQKQEMIWPLIPGEMKMLAEEIKQRSANINIGFMILSVYVKLHFI